MLDPLSWDASYSRLGLTCNLYVAEKHGLIYRGYAEIFSILMTIILKDFAQRQKNKLSALWVNFQLQNNLKDVWNIPVLANSLGVPNNLYMFFAFEKADPSNIVLTISRYQKRGQF